MTPTVLGLKVFSEHTLVSYDMRDGESTHSIERLPFYKVQVLKNGDIVMDEDGPIVRCVFGPFIPRTTTIFKEFDVIGLNHASISFASEILRTTALKSMIFAHRPDEVFEISQGKHLPDGMTAEEINDYFLKSLQYNGAEVETFFKRRMREEKAKKSTKEPVSMDDVYKLNLILSPSLSNGIPSDLRSSYTSSKPIVNFNNNHFRDLQIEGNSQPSLFAFTENPEFWTHIAERRDDFSEVTVFSGRLSRQTVFNDWVKHKVLEKIFIEHPSDFKSAYQTNLSPSSVFAVDSQYLKGHWVKDFKDDDLDRIYINFLCQTRNSGVNAIGPGTAYANPHLTKLLTDHPKSTQVHQGVVAAKIMKGKEATLNILPFSCFSYKQRPICELGIVGQADSVWEIGDPEQGDYFGLWVDKTGKIEGIQTVGIKEQKRALLLQEAILLGCLPKKPRFWTDKQQWQLLEQTVLRRLLKAGERPKFPTINRR